jgi:hypothetical protein
VQVAVGQNLDMTVIVEPDSIGAWIGLAGVAVGALLTGGVTWLQGARRERKERSSATEHACTELWAAAESVQLLSRMLRVGTEVPVLEWSQAIATAVNRVIIAADTVNRLAPGDLGKAALSVAAAALDINSDEPVRGEALTKALKEFHPARMAVLGK